MFCIKCDKDLADCECPDMPERLQDVLNCGLIAFGEDYLRRLLRRAEEIKGKRELDNLHKTFSV